MGMAKMRAALPSLKVRVTGRFLEEFFPVCDPEERRLCLADATRTRAPVEPCPRETLEDASCPCGPRLTVPLGLREYRLFRGEIGRRHGAIEMFAAKDGRAVA